MTSSGVLEAVDRILNRGGEVGDVLREVVAALVERGGCASAAVLFDQGRGFVVGPQAGRPQPDVRLRLPISFEGKRVAELIVDRCPDPALAERVALVISPYCLDGWETGGVGLEEAS